MQTLTFITLERLTIIVTIAFIITRFAFIRRLINETGITQKQTVGAMIVFGVFGIIGTHTGIVYDVSSGEYSSWVFMVDKESAAIINFRVLGVAVAGLLGGVWIGLGAGIIAGAERALLGGFTAYSCGVSAIVTGLLAGFLHDRLNLKQRLNPVVAIFVGLLAESLQMTIILFFDQFSQRAWVLVEQIGRAMILVNAVGCGLFILIIRNVLNEEDSLRALQAQKSLSIAEETLKHLSNGLNTESAKATCTILLNEINADAVAITDQQQILAHVGIAADHHKVNDDIKTAATKKVFSTGDYLIVDKVGIGCIDPECVLQAAIISPLKCAEDIIGTLKLYFNSEKDINNTVIELVKGLTSLLNYQLEMAQADKLRSLATDSELKMLQAQIEPHFFHNSLNIIKSLIRDEPDKSRKLLQSLSTFFRHKLTENSTLELELQHIQAYLNIQSARYEDNLSVQFEIDESVIHYRLPPLVLQPIVENAIQYCVDLNSAKGKLIIEVQNIDGDAHIRITDNGIGISIDKIAKLGNMPTPSEKGSGTAIYNINRRLTGTLGQRAKITIDSQINRGTTVSFVIPRNTEDE